MKYQYTVTEMILNCMEVEANLITWNYLSHLMIRKLNSRISVIV